jgi:hypothetical protein
MSAIGPFWNILITLVVLVVIVKFIADLITMGSKMNKILKQNQQILELNQQILNQISKIKTDD